MKALLMYNPNSMKGKIKDKIPYIVKRLSCKYEVDTIAPDSAEHSSSIAEQRSPQYDVIIVAGGDGSVHQVANGIARAGAKCILGILPMGTVNDVSRNLKIKPKLDAAIDVILRGASLPYDLIYDGQHYSVYTYACGKFVESSIKATRQSKKVWGRLAYFLHGVGRLFVLRTFPLTVRSNGEEHKGDFSFFLLLNSYNTAGFFLNGQSSVSDGLMDIIMVKKRGNSFCNFFYALWTICVMFLFGTKAIKNYRSVIILQTSRVEIENPANMLFTKDGEGAEFLNTELITGEGSKQLQVFHGIDL